MELIFSLFANYIILINKASLSNIKFDILLRRLGLERTGLLGMFLLVSTSTLSVVSIFIPGSPFINWILDIEREQRYEASSLSPNMLKEEELLVVVKDQNDENTKNLNGQLYPSNVPHITLLMTGIILARFGTWLYPDKIMAQKCYFH